MDYLRTRRQRRRRQFLASVPRGQRVNLTVEPLESRNLLAGNVLGDLVDDIGTAQVFDMAAAVSSPTTGFGGVSVSGGEGEGGEGEDAPDLVAFAKALDQAGVKFFGAAWCPACETQKELFEDGERFLPFIEVTNPNRSLNQIGMDNNIQAFPTWDFPDGNGGFERRVETLSLAQISQLSGVAIPQSSTPTFAPIDDVTLLDYSPTYVALDGYDPNGDPITYTVESDNALVVPVILQNGIQGTRSATIDVVGYGNMTFYLFDDMAPRPVERFTTLANQGFYDDVIFHRVIDGFVIQGGDPTGTGSGGSGLGTFDDQYHFDLQHNVTGLLSYAKSSDDTNDSQFFITEGPARHLDFNHSIFGFLVEGEANREAISNTAVQNSRPTNTIAMETVTIFTDDENAVIQLLVMQPANGEAEGQSGEANITVTARDPDGNESSQTFHVTVQPDTNIVTRQANANGQIVSVTYDENNSPPFLSDIAPVMTTVNTPVQFQLVGNDVEGGPIDYTATSSGNTGANVSVTSNGLVTVTPPTNFIGTFDVQVSAVKGDAVANEQFVRSIDDQQTVTVTVAPARPTLDLLEGSDSNVPTDNITNVTNMTFRVSNVVDGATVQILNNGSVIASGTASGTSIDLTTNALATIGDGSYTLTARQTVSNTESPTSAPLTVTLDTTPPGDFTSTPPTTATNGVQVNYNAQNPDEGSTGFQYALIDGPDGAAISTVTGQFVWTPTQEQAGVHNFTIRAIDAAGNSTDQNVSINVTVVPQKIEVRLRATDTAGNIITELEPGQDFRLDVFVQDVRANEPDARKGVFAMYLDIAYDSNLATTLAQSINDIDFSSTFGGGRFGVFSQEGLIDEIGAFRDNLSPSGPNVLRLLTIPMRAGNEAGTLIFTTSPADDSGHEPLVYFENDPVALNTVSYGTLTLEVGAGLEAIDDVFNVDEDSTDNSLNVLLNDTNDAGGTLTITDVGTTSNGGTVTIVDGGQRISYSPAPDFNGEDVFTYTMTDGTLSSTATVTVQIAPINDDPMAMDDAFNVAAGASNVFLDLLANDSREPDVYSFPLETLRIIGVSGFSHGGSATVATNGTHVNYTPAAGFSGIETFSYTIGDGRGGLDTATVTVTVAAAPDPQATDDTATVAEDSTANRIEVLDNDSPNQAGAALTVTGVGQTSNGGAVTISQDGKAVIYTPATGFVGNETFSYTVSEANGGSATAMVTVTVTDQGIPVAADDSATVLEDSDATEIDVLANDMASDTGLTLSVVAVTQSTRGGTVTIAADGLSVSYEPAPDFQGTDTFTYTIQESGSTVQATATVTVTVENVNDDPNAVDDSFSIAKDAGAQTFNVLDNDDDAPDEGETLTITSVTQGNQGGTVTIVSNGTALEYTSAAGFEGTETFTYTISDGNGGTDTATVTVVVLEYVPRAVSGNLVLAFDNGQSGLGGISIRLHGTDDFGNAVDVTTRTRINGSYHFGDLPPGNYQVEYGSQMFLVGSPSPLSIVSGTGDGDSTGNNAATLSRDPASLSVADFSVRAHPQSSLAPPASILAAVEAGGTHHWYRAESGWDDFVSGEIELAADLSEVTISVTDDSGQTFRGVVPVGDVNVIRFLARSDNSYLIRIFGNANELGLQAVAGEAEGEADVDAAGAEGEAAPVSASAAAAPTARIIAEQMTVQPTMIAPPAGSFGGEGEMSAAQSSAVQSFAVLSSAVQSSAIAMPSTTSSSLLANARPTGQAKAVRDREDFPVSTFWVSSSDSLPSISVDTAGIGNSLSAATEEDPGGIFGDAGDLGANRVDELFAAAELEQFKWDDDTRDDDETVVDDNAAYVAALDAVFKDGLVYAQEN